MVAQFPQALLSLRVSQPLLALTEAFSDFGGMVVGKKNPRYAREVLGESVGAKWEDVVEEDIWAFLGFALLMGINRLPQLRLYWITDPVYHYLPIAERIIRDRFLAIWRFLHFTRNAPSPVAST